MSRHRKNKRYAFSRENRRPPNPLVEYMNSMGDAQEKLLRGYRTKEMVVFGGSRRSAMMPLPHPEPELDTKGVFHGLCNMSSCLSPHEVEWYNHGSRAYYCPECASLLNHVNWDFVGMYGHKLCTHYEENLDYAADVLADMKQHQGE